MVFTDEEDKDNFYSELKSAAESGWDFSTRWFIVNGTNKGKKWAFTFVFRETPPSTTTNLHLQRTETNSWGVPKKLEGVQDHWKCLLELLKIPKVSSSKIENVPSIKRKVLKILKISNQ